MNQIREEMEQRRLMIVNWSKRLLFIGIILLILNLLVYHFLDHFFIACLIISILVSVLPLGYTLDLIDKYKKYFKNTLMPILIKTVGENIEYDYKRGITESICMEAKLFKNPDIFTSEDLVTGRFEDVSFISSDVIMKERKIVTDSKGRARVTYEVFFSGRWFVYDFNKTFNGIIQVREGSFLLGSWNLKLEKIKLEDVEFNKKFSTYASNQHDAFYVLTPSLIENIKEFERKNPGKVYFSFIGSKLHIAVNGAKNTFEAPIYRPISDEFMLEQINDIKLIQNIVHELRLNRKIFK